MLENPRRQQGLGGPELTGLGEVEDMNYGDPSNYPGMLLNPNGPNMSNGAGLSMEERLEQEDERRRWAMLGWPLVSGAPGPSTLYPYFSPRTSPFIPESSLNGDMGFSLPGGQYVNNAPQTATPPLMFTSPPRLVRI
jgi:hypothetical protein